MSSFGEFSDFEGRALVSSGMVLLYGNIDDIFELGSREYVQFGTDFVAIMAGIMYGTVRIKVVGGLASRETLAPLGVPEIDESGAVKFHGQVAIRTFGTSECQELFTVPEARPFTVRVRGYRLTDAVDDSDAHATWLVEIQRKQIWAAGSD